MNRAWTMQEALMYGQGVERAFLCPVHGDSRPSAYMNTIKHVWVCFSCGAKGKLSGEDLLIEPDYEVMRTWFEEKMEESRVYPEAWLSRWDAGVPHPYWVKRVGVEAARRFRLGYDPERDAVTYPLRDASGQVLGVVRRPLHGDGPKYLYPKGIDVGRLLFNYDGVRRSSVVVLCEGALDAIALWNAGIHAFAIYGARLSEDQIRLVDRLDPTYVVTAYDRDDAGWRVHCQTERAFRHRMVSRLVWPRAWGKDVDEAGLDHLRSLVEPLVQLDPLCLRSSTCTTASLTSQQRPPSTASTSQPRVLTMRRNAA